MKCCSICGEEKLEVDFYRISSTGERLRSACKKCTNRQNLAGNKKYKKNHPEKVKNYSYTWAKKNRKKVYLFNKRWREKNPEKWRSYLLKWRTAPANKKKITDYRRRRYQASPEVRRRQYARRLAQGISLKEKCEICGNIGILEKHHPDYNKPKFIITVCKPCHWKIHTSL